MKSTFPFVILLLLAMGTASAWLAWPGDIDHSDRLELQEVKALVMSGDDQIRLTLEGRGIDSRTRFSLYPDFGNRQLIQSRLPLDSQVWGLAGRGHHVYVANGTAGLVIVDVSQPDRPAVLSSLALPGAAWRVALRGDVALVLTIKEGLHLVDVSAPEHPVLLHTLALSGPLLDFVCNDRFAYVAAAGRGVYVIDLKNPADPILLKTIRSPGGGRGVALQGDQLAVAAGNQGVLLFHGAAAGALELVAQTKVDDKLTQVEFASAQTLYAASSSRLYQIPLGVDPAPAKLVQDDLFSVFCLTKSEDKLLVGTDQGIYVYAQTIDSELELKGFLANSSTIGDLLFIQERIFFGDNLFGLQAFPENAVFRVHKVLGHSFPGSANSFALLGSRLVLAGSPYGLRIDERLEGNQFESLGALYPDRRATSFALGAGRIYLGATAGGLIVMENNQGRLQTLNRIELPGVAVDMLRYQTLLLVADSVAGLLCFDISEPDHPLRVSSLPSEGSPVRLAYADSTVYLADAHGGLLVASLSEDGSLLERQRLSLSEAVEDVAVLRDQVVVQLETGELLQLKKSAGLLRPAGSVKVSGGSHSIDATGDRLYVYTHTPELLVFGAGQSLTGNLVLVDHLPMQGLQGTLRLQDGVLQVAVPGHGVYLYSTEDSRKLSLIEQIEGPQKVIDFQIDGEQVLVLNQDNSVALFARKAAGNGIEDFLNADGQVVKLLGNLALLSIGDRLQVIDISRPDELRIVGALKFPGSVTDIEIKGEIVYVTVRGHGLYLTDVTASGVPRVISFFKTPGSALAVAIKENLALVACSEAGLVSVDVSNPTKPVLRDALVLAHPLNKFSDFRDVAVAGGFAFVADLQNGLIVASVTAQGDLEIVSQLKMSGYASSLFHHNQFIYVADHLAGIVVIDVKDPPRPELLCNIEWARVARDLWVDDDDILALAGRAAFFSVPVPRKGTGIVPSANGLSVQFQRPRKAGYYSIRAAGLSGVDDLVGRVHVNEQGVVSLH